MVNFHLNRRSLLAAAGAAGISLNSKRANAQSKWDTLPEKRPTSSVVPAKELRGPHYALGPTVTTIEYMNNYNVTSDYGAFVASSDTRLRRLIREIAAIAEIKQIEQTAAFKNAAIEAGKAPFRSAANLVNDPVNTLSAIPEGIGSIFNRATEQVQRSGRSQYEDDMTKEVLAVSAFKREYAAKLGVDVYSSNAVLQDELDRVAWASAAGNLSLGALSVATGAIALQLMSNVRLLEQAQSLVESTPPSELSQRNRELLLNMQVPEIVVDGFLENGMLSPRHQTIIVASMVSLGNMPGRSDFIAYATQAETEDEALVFQQMAELMASYSASVSPVEQIKIIDNFPVSYNKKGGAVLLLPFDRLLWTMEMAALAKNLLQKISKPQPVSSTEIWITGDASVLAEAGMKNLGFGLTERCGKRLPLLD